MRAMSRRIPLRCIALAMTVASALCVPVAGRASSCTPSRDSLTGSWDRAERVMLAAVRETTSEPDGPDRTRYRATVEVLEGFKGAEAGELVHLERIESTAWPSWSLLLSEGEIYLLFLTSEDTWPLPCSGSRATYGTTADGQSGAWLDALRDVAEGSAAHLRDPWVVSVEGCGAVITSSNRGRDLLTVVLGQRRRDQVHVRLSAWPAQIPPPRPPSAALLNVGSVLRRVEAEPRPFPSWHWSGVLTPDDALWTALGSGDDLEIRLVSDDGSSDTIVHRQDGEELASVWRAITGCEPPPPPAHLRPEKIHHVDPVYSSAGLAARVQGVVIMEAVIDREGSVRDPVVVKGLGYGLDEAAIEAVSRWRFRPATEDGESVATGITLTLSFRLP